VKEKKERETIEVREKDEQKQANIRSDRSMVGANNFDELSRQ
jgi:hypothetical protein